AAASSAVTPQTSITTSQAPQGNWVSTYGADGSALLDWNQPSDLVSLPASASLVIDHASRWQWATSATDPRDLQSPDGSTRRATTIFDGTEIRLHLAFSAGYSGTLHLYALDWENAGRRETVSVNDGSGARTAATTTGCSQGIWITA